MIRRDSGQLHSYQITAIRQLLHHPRAALWLDMGLGKTAVTLFALQDLMDRLHTFGALVVAPLRVCQTIWRQEADKWNYTKSLTFSAILGTQKQRRRALHRPAQIYLTNYEHLVWLVEEIDSTWLSKGRYPPFDCIVLDETSRLKSTRMRQGGKRGAALLRLLPYMRRRIGLTGTPAAEGYLDLFGQYLCLDGGQRLGSSYSGYREKWFYQTDFAGHSFAPFRHSEAEIRDRIADITLSMSNEDYLALPPLMINDIYVDLPQQIRMKYEQMERQFLLEFDSGSSLQLNTEASKINRCLQVANGACYLQPGEPEWELLHDEKMKALEEIIEEAAGKPVLLSYQFQHDAHRIMKKYKKARWISSKLNEKGMVELQNDWNEGKVPLMLGHPQSMGHGLNLQAGSSTLVWFGLTWSQGSYSQTIARLRRQGQTKPVVVHRILARNTFDNVQRIVLREKRAMEYSIRQAIEEYRKAKVVVDFGDLPP